MAGQRGRLEELHRRGYWPAQVPAVVLAEALTGDHRRDFHVNRLLKACQIRDVDERQSREAARLRTATERAGRSPPSMPSSPPSPVHDPPRSC